VAEAEAEAEAVAVADSVVASVAVGVLVTLAARLPCEGRLTGWTLSPSSGNHATAADACVPSASVPALSDEAAGTELGPERAAETGVVAEPVARCASLAERGNRSDEVADA
jgi:hypothetical protein